MIKLSALLALTGALVSAQTIPTRTQIYAAMTGQWTGHLEYRDYQSDERVMLPTWLDVKSSSDGNSVTFTYTYDDGPTKTVSEKSTITIDPAARTYTTTSEGDHTSSAYQIEELTAGKHGIQITLSGHGTENDKPVDVRIRIRIDRNLYRFEKETRVPGKDFQFRDAYILTRRTPPQN